MTRTILKETPEQGNQGFPTVKLIGTEIHYLIHNKTI
jgi:hypothetical protein